MKLNKLVTAFAVATGAWSQVLPSSVAGLTFSPQCQQAIIQVVTNSSFAECFQTADLLPLFTLNTSIVPVLDKFMSDLCYSSMTCSNTTLQNASQTILSGCSTDLQGEGLPTSVVTTAFGLYPLVREMLCLKTTDPYTNASYGGVLGSPPIPISSPGYNSTGGYFCVTSVLTQLSAYLKSNLTVPYIESLATASNMTALQLVKSVQPNILCNGCVFGALDLMEETYPVIGNVPIATIYAVLNQTTTLPANTTINSLVNGECTYANLTAMTNGTLPANISVSIINSTFPLPVANST